MARKKDPRIDQVVSLLPADGAAISHVAWRDAIVQTGQLGNLAMTQAARRSGDVIFEIGNVDDPAGSLTVRRAFIAAPAAAPVPAAPRPTTTTTAGGNNAQ